MTCSVEICDRPGEIKHLCKAHYNRLQATGDVQAHLPIRRRAPLYGPECRVGGCGRPRAQRFSVCAGHRKRLASGNLRPDVPLRPLAAAGSGTVNPGGYRVVYRPGHPVAHRSGEALEHRVVLYEAIGPGEHRCHWCSTPVRWDDVSLHVDHLDADRLHNTPANLVPSCLPCNSSRSNAGNPLDWVPRALAATR